MAIEADLDADAERRALIRAVRQRLDSLRRAGIDQLPMLPLPLPGPPGRAGANAVPGRARVAAPLIAPRPGPPAAVPAPPPAIRLPAAAEAAPIPARVERPSLPPPVAPSLFGDPAPEPAVPVADRLPILTTLAGEVANCPRCPELVATRTRTVFGEGSPTARLMFIGEAPGADEDASGRPFIGRAGALLTDMITKGMGLGREDVYIANVLKCRPPDNRTPALDEMTNCLPYLIRQIATIRPEFLCLLGKTAALALLETALPLGKLRGKWHRYQAIPTIVTYHPAYLLRNPASKKDTWEDLQTLMRAMGIKPPDRRKPG